MRLYSNRLQKVKENGKTYLVHKDTGEKIQIWSDEVRANQTKRRRNKCVLTKNGCVKQCNPNRCWKDSWKMCDAIHRGGKPCNKWVVVSLDEYRNPDHKFRCSYCIKNNRPYQ